jgi:predicted XRE-type DNA-binding protein
MRRNEMTASSGNVFADLGLKDSAELRVKAVLLSTVAMLVTEQKLTQKAAAKLLGVDQPKVSAIMNGKLSLFSTERLMEFLTALGNDVEIVVKKRSKSNGKGRIQVLSSAPL